MQYSFLTTSGALHEGRGAAFDEADAAAVLSAPADGSDPPADSPVSVQNLAGHEIDSGVLALIPEFVARENTVVPIAFDGERLTVATDRPGDIGLADKLRFLLALDIKLVHAPAAGIREVINREYGASHAESVDSCLYEFTDTEIDFADDHLKAKAGRSAPARRSRQPDASRRICDVRRPLYLREGRRGRPEHADGDQHSERSRGGRGMWFYTVDEGQQVLMTRRDGTSEILVGPRRVWRGLNRFEPMRQYVAHPGEFLIVRFRDGTQEHRTGPAEVWFDERIHDGIEKQDALQIAANEAVVVYTESADNSAATRRVELGPQLFAPKPGEWLHTFTWHASKGGSQGASKIAKGLVFQKLWLMPDQMYHDVPDVRTADDAVLTIRLMIFFELTDIDRMLDTTHDPIGDFVNAATADVVEFTGHHDFESFKQHTNQLNELETYRNLTRRADHCGYRINNVVYRGYGAPESLQQMHDQAIEARTRLQLERATEEQAQELESFKLESQLARSAKRRSEQSEEVRHDLDMARQKHGAELAQREARLKFEREQREQSALQEDRIERQRNAAREEHLKSLSEMGVGLTEFLTHSRADEVIELRGNGAAPHVHVGRMNSTNGAES